MKMDTKDKDDFREQRSHKARMEVLQQLSEEALRIGSYSWDNSPPSSCPSFNNQTIAAFPSHRRARSEVPFSLHMRSDSHVNLQKLKGHVLRAFNWGSRSFHEVNRYSFDPETLANQKRQWYQLKSKAVDTEKYKEPSSLFEHFVVVGLHPDAKLKVVEDAFIKKKKWEQEIQRTEMLENYVPQNMPPKFPTLDPEVLFMYPPGKKLSLHLKDLAAFCFPEGVKAHIVERTPSLSELNELVYGQEHLHRDDLSFIFSLKVADSATLYGVCLHVQEVVQKPPVVYGDPSLSQSHSRRSRFLVSAPRCYCILTRVPFFELHYEMLNSIIAQERLNRVTKFVTEMTTPNGSPSQSMLKNQKNENVGSPTAESATDWLASAIRVDSAATLAAAAAGIISDEEASSRWEFESQGSATTSDTSQQCQMTELHKDNTNLPSSNGCSSETSEHQSTGGHTSDVRPYICARNLSSRSFESIFSPARSMQLEEDGILCNNNEDFRVDMIMEWARENKNDTLQIICEYHSMHLPARGDKIIFCPLEHLQAIEYQRPPISALGLDDTYDIEGSEETSQVKLKLAAAEGAVSLSLWSTATICRVLSLESVLALVTGVLLEKQVIVQCPNLGVLSAVVLSFNPIIRPFEWQSLFLPVLPEKMVDFLDAPVPFIVGIQNKPSDLKKKASNLVRADVLKNKVKSCTLPPLPGCKELISKLRPIHSILSCQDSIAQKHPIYKCSEVQAVAAINFLNEMRKYMESLCSDLRFHSITSVHSDNDKVAVLIKDSFIESFPDRDQPFVKLFVETQLFTILSDSRLASFEHE